MEETQIERSLKLPKIKVRQISHTFIKLKPRILVESTWQLCRSYGMLSNPKINIPIELGHWFGWGWKWECISTSNHECLMLLKL